MVLSPSLQQTFSRAKLWLEELEKKFLPDEIVIALVGNKTDLAAEREVTTEVSAWVSLITLRRKHWDTSKKNFQGNSTF